MAAPELSDVELHYLPVRSKGEHVRMLLRAAALPFKDVVYPFTMGDDGWPAAKKAGRFPFGRLPVLCFTSGGSRHMLSESGAIARLLATRAGLHPADAVAAAHADALYDAARDLDEIDPVYNGFTKDAGECGRVLDAAEAHLARLAAASLLPSGAPFLRGDAPVAADFLVFCFANNLLAIRPDALRRSAAPQLAAWYERVAALPAVADVLASRADVPPSATGLAAAR